MGKGTLNRVVLVGNLGRAPEVRYTASGSAVGRLALATSDVWTDRGGEKQESTEWHRVVVFGKTAEVAEKYLGKGSKVLVEGRLQTERWTGKDGVERTRTQVVAERMEMLDRAARTEGASRPNGMPGRAGPSGPVADPLEDDIPF